MNANKIILENAKSQLETQKSKSYNEAYSIKMAELKNEFDKFSSEKNSEFQNTVAQKTAEYNQSVETLKKAFDAAIAEKKKSLDEQIANKKKSNESIAELYAQEKVAESDMFISNIISLLEKAVD